MSKKFFIKRAEKVIGPHDISLLINTAQKGKLLSSDEISVTAHGPWELVLSNKELRQVLEGRSAKKKKSLKIDDYKIISPTIDPMTFVADKDEYEIEYTCVKCFDIITISEDEVKSSFRCPSCNIRSKVVPEVLEEIAEKRNSLNRTKNEHQQDVKDVDVLLTAADEENLSNSNSFVPSTQMRPWLKYAAVGVAFLFSFVFSMSVIQLFSSGELAGAAFMSLLALGGFVAGTSLLRLKNSWKSTESPTNSVLPKYTTVKFIVCSLNNLCWIGLFLFICSYIDPNAVAAEARVNPPLSGFFQSIKFYFFGMIFVYLSKATKWIVCIPFIPYDRVERKRLGRMPAGPCPYCGDELNGRVGQYPNCHRCGQEIDWGPLFN